MSENNYYTLAGGPSPEEMKEVDRVAQIGDAMQEAITKRKECQICHSPLLAARPEAMPNGQMRITVTCQECGHITDQILV